MSELDLIRKIRRMAGRPPSGATLGIGDDCAIIRGDARTDLVFTTDLLIEDVHFKRATHSAEDVGHKALARGLSDLAAMGAEPFFCLLSLAVPKWADEDWTGAFHRGFFRLARRTRTKLLGGDVASARKFVCDIVCCGRVPHGKALLRSGARPGDEIWVSGQLGGSALGLRRQQGTAFRRHLRPEPRLELGQYLRKRLGATAAMDLSDGLSLDLHRLCVESGVSAELTGELPWFPGATEADALHGGEDYELLFTVPAGTKAPSAWKRIRLSRIGTVRKGHSGRIRLAGKDLEPAGYDHFR